MRAGSFFNIVAKNFDVLAGPLVSLVYPLYASIRAIETKSSVDDQQWLTYWVLHSLITLFELTFATIIEWLPFWPYAKLVFNCWLVLPYFNGAAYVYQQFVRPFCINQKEVNIWYVPRGKGIFSKPDDVLIAAEKFLEKNGPGAFEKLMKKAGTALKLKKNDKNLTVDENETKQPPESEKKSNKRATFDESETKLPSKSEKKSNKRVTFDESEAKKELKSMKVSSNKKGLIDEVQNTETSNTSPNSWHWTTNESETENETDFWRNSNFMIFDDDHRYWT